ncbi:MAG: hypothetical protein ACIAXF_01090 [Phycisphaerales bacterium JB063]
MHELPTLIADEDGVALFTTAQWPEETRGGLVLSPRIGASSLRLRTSEPGYTADWHVAGEPVLIVVRRGTLRIGLRDGTHRDFSAGDAFVAADSVPEGEAFDPATHGHTAQVVGEQTLEAVHIKLAALPEDRPA